MALASAQTRLSTKAFGPAPKRAGLPVTAASRKPCVAVSASSGQQEAGMEQGFQRVVSVASACLVAASLMVSPPALARPEGVNRPDLLPKEFSTVIDVAGFLTPSEEKRIAAEVESLERDTGIKVRVLAQNYPETPGLAIREYWGTDEGNAVVMVADPTFGDILNFNVGQLVDLEVPRSFWSRLAGQYGNKFYWQEKGEAESILNAVSAIDTCLREPQGRFKCAKVQGEFGEKDTSGKFGKFFGQ